MKIINLRKRSRGFTLVESLLAAFIIATLFIFVISTFPILRQGMQLSENHHNATIIGSSLLDEARRAGFGGITPVSGSQTISGTNNGASFNQVFNYSTSVQTLDTDKKEVWATITWHESTGNKQLVVETLIVNPNP